MEKEEKSLFTRTVKAFIKTKRFDRKSILPSYMLVSTEFAEAYRKKYGKDRVFPLLQASMVLKRLFANILEKEGIRFNRKDLFRFEDKRGEKEKHKGDAAVIASEITDRVKMAAAGDRS